MSTNVLDAKMLHLGSGDYVTGRDFAQNILVTGVTGGGKTSGPGRNILQSLAGSGAGGMIACAKPSEAEEVCAMLRAAGRGPSIIVWNGRNHGLNLFSYAMARLGQDGVNSLIEYIMRIVEIMRNASAVRGGDGDAFWLDELKRMLRYTVMPVYRATGTLRLADILAFVRSAPTSLEQMQDETWKAHSFFFAVIAAAADAIDDASGEQLMGYWREFAQLDGKLRGSILAGFTMIDRLNHGWLGDTFCSDTTIVPALCFHGAIIVLDMSRATHGEDGMVAQMLVLDAFQTEVLGRNALEPAQRQRFVFIYADEYQEFVTSRHAEFLALSRSSLCSTIALTQSLPSLYSKLGGPNAHDRAHHLISNMGVRIFCANSCTTTNEWASRTIGKAVQRRANFSESEGTNQNFGANMGENSGWNRQVRGTSFFGGFGASDPFDWNLEGSEGGGDNWGRNRGYGSSQGTSRGYSETIDDVVPAGFFASGLKTGGPQHGNRVGAIWVQAGRRWAASSGPARYVEFAQ